MFNALNRIISRLDGDAPTSKDHQSAFGFQVLRNENTQLAIEPWFDFVVGINGRMIDSSDPRLFALEIRNRAGSTVTLGLWSAKGQRTRPLQVLVPSDPPLLGLTLQWTSLSVASTIWHVLDVPARSPADIAGLLPYGDYILGTPEGILHGESGLGELVEDHIGRPLRLYVYNNEYDVSREVTITPSRDWGGSGALGCVLGYGALHRLPAPLSEPVSGPGETMFEVAGTGEKDQEPENPQWYPQFEGGGDGPYVPAQVFAAAGTEPMPVPRLQGGSENFVDPNASASPAAGPSKARKKGPAHGHGTNTSMMDYLKEEEQRSREIEGTTGSVGRASPLPPPPKAGMQLKVEPPRAEPPTAEEEVSGEKAVA